MKNCIATLLIGLSLLLISCEDIIQVKLDKNTQNLFGVEAGINNADGPFVFLYKTLSVDQDVAFPGTSNALVTISDNSKPSNKINLVESPTKKGLYVVPQFSIYPGVPGREYTVTIQVQGTTLTAKDLLSKVEPIDSILVEPSLRGNKKFLGVFTYGKEPKGLGNYYKWDLYVNKVLVYKAGMMAIASDEFVDGNYISKLEIYTDFYKPGNELKDRSLHLNDTVFVKQTSISRFAYKFYYQLINQSNSGSLFSVPPANIAGNFTSSDGKQVLGVFIARDISVSNSVIITQKIENQLNK